MCTKQVTEPNDNVEITIDKLEADITYLEKLDIGPTQANIYIKTKKELVGYVGRTYSKLTKESIETLTYKLASIVGPVMPTKQVTSLMQWLMPSMPWWRP